MTSQAEIDAFEARLNDFDPAARRQALLELAGRAAARTISLPPPAGVANMHCHTFFSFNAWGHSPSSLAWLARRRGYRLLGIVDFDVLDGVDEFLAACDLVGLRGSAGIETRIFVPEFAAAEINSPGEPGVCYHMAIGFVSGQVPAGVAPILADLRARAGRRNQEMVARVNAHLEAATVDYERDVLPLTPAGNPTERHLLLAYARAAERSVGDLPGFWADKLGVPPGQVAQVMGDYPAFSNLVRARLMKQGGVGYARPEAGAFPTMNALHELAMACGALPCAAWLDGGSAVERDIETWLEFLVSKGVVALNIIPDRNWNVAEPDVRRQKVERLYEVVHLAQGMGLPLNVGTEMNAFGNKLVDDFDAPELAPVREVFLDGAYFVYGHTALQRALGLGYQSDWAQATLPARRERCVFYTRAGRLISPGQDAMAHLRRLDATLPPGELLARLAEQPREVFSHEQ